MDLDAQLTAGLAHAGIPVCEDELPLLRIVHAAFGPAVGALLDADLRAVEVELVLDPGRPPR